ncbi:MAG TPA: hypothetical protein VHP14_03105, partial [Anaerolineales bacterium]|nr:hypothetical protein [Anaerolineales bacterium]
MNVIRFGERADHDDILFFFLCHLLSFIGIEICLTNNPRFAWDSYRRLVEMFGTTVFNLDDEVFEHPMAEYKAKKGYKLDTEMTAEDWKALVATFKDVFKKHVGFEFPQDVYKQLE